MKFSIWSKSEGWKGSTSGCLVNGPKIKKLIVLKCYLLSFYAITTNHFLIRLWHAMKSGFYTTTRDNQLSSWIKKKLQSTSQSQTCSKKGHGHWWSAAGLIHYSFQNPGETITSEKHVQQIDKIYWKLQCLQPALVNRKGPILLHDITQPHFTQLMLQKLNELGYEVLPHLPYSPDLSWTDYYFFRLFAGKKLPQSVGCRICFPGCCRIPNHKFLC